MSGRVIFDDLRYVASLAHLGRPMAVPSLPFGVLKRPIPGTAHHDVLSTWPYGSAPDPARLPAAAGELRDAGAVSFTGMITPAAALEPARLAVGCFTVAPLKPHYVIDRRQGLPVPSAKTRRNLRIASRAWTVDPAPARPDIARTAVLLYAALRRRRQMSSEVTQLPPEHFPTLLDVPGIVCLAARNGDAIGALIIAARDAGESHLLHFLADETATASCPTYLLMSYVSEAWANDGPVYLGGAPDGPAGPGVAKFKSRWASRTAPAWLLTAILREDLYRELAPRGAAADGYFPAYRRGMTAADPARPDDE
jgi:hypothetical protein